jgi:hypothetical protein
MTLRTFFAIGTGMALLAVLGGCQGEEQVGFPVSGAITLHGQPLDHGTIQFEPLEGQETSSGAVIENGRYEIPAERGLGVGNYAVRISSGEPGTAAEDAAPGESGPLAKERIPASFNVQTDVKVQVKKDTANAFDFQIP